MCCWRACFIMAEGREQPVKWNLVLGCRKPQDSQQLCQLPHHTFLASVNLAALFTEGFRKWSYLIDTPHPHFSVVWMGKGWRDACSVPHTPFSLGRKGGVLRTRSTLQCSVRRGRGTPGMLKKQSMALIAWVQFRGCSCALGFWVIVVLMSCLLSVLFLVRSWLAF